MPDVDDDILPAFSADDIRALWAAAKTLMEKAVMLFLLDTGVRAFELLALNGGDVDLASGEVLVRKGKGKKGRGYACTCHMFRRTFALESLRSGMNVFILQRLMGHKDLQVLLRYLALVENDLKAALT